MCVVLFLLLLQIFLKSVLMYRSHCPIQGQNFFSRLQKPIPIAHKLGFTRIQ
jgi:hypothetical protein